MAARKRTVKVRMKGSSWASRGGDEVAVTEETAEFLLAEGHAAPASPAAEKVAAEVEGAPGDQ